MDVPQKVQRLKIVQLLPNEIWQEDQPRRPLPYYSHLLFNYCLASVNNIPAISPPTKNGIEYFDSMPNPTPPPIALHQRGSADLTPSRGDPMHFRLSLAVSAVSSFVPV
jgi:hypothetical protein